MAANINRFFVTTIFAFIAITMLSSCKNEKPKKQNVKVQALRFYNGDNQEAEEINQTSIDKAFGELRGRFKSSESNFKLIS